MKRIKDNDNATIVACYIGYITQAIVNNFVPLLFVTFQKQFGIALDKIGLLISVNFGVQLLVDLLREKNDDYSPSMQWDRTFTACLFAVAVSSSIYRASDRNCLLCHRRRADRSHVKSDCGGVPDKEQGGGDELAALFLLLGTCGSGTDQYPVFCSIRDRILVDFGLYLGSYSLF